MCTVVETDGGVPVYEDYKIAIKLFSDMDRCLLHPVCRGGQGITELCGSLPEGGAGRSPCLTISY